MGRKPGTSQEHEKIINNDTVLLGRKFTKIRGRRWTYELLNERGIRMGTLTRLTNGHLLITEEMRELFDRLAQIMGISTQAFEPELGNAIRSCAAMVTAAPNVSLKVELSDSYYKVGQDRLPELWESIQIYRPLSGPVSGIQASYIYTGADQPEKLEIRRGGRLGEPPKLARTGFRSYWIDFQRDIEPTETHLVHVVVTYPGATELPEPFATSSVQGTVASCERMIVRVLFDPLMTPARIFHCEGPTHLIGVFDEPPGPEVQARSGQYYFEREVPDPQPLHHYGFKWEWDTPKANTPESV